MQRSEVVASACGYSDIKTWGGDTTQLGLRLSVFLVHTISTWESVDDFGNGPNHLQKLVSYRRNACCKQEQTRVTCESVYTTGVWRSPKRWEHAFSWPHQAVPPCKRLRVLVNNLPMTSWHQNTGTVHQAEPYLYHLGWAAPNDMHMVEQKNNISQPGEEEEYGDLSHKWG